MKRLLRAVSLEDWTLIVLPAVGITVLLIAAFTSGTSHPEKLASFLELLRAYYYAGGISHFLFFVIFLLMFSFTRATIWAARFVGGYIESGKASARMRESALRSAKRVASVVMRVLIPATFVGIALSIIVPLASTQAVAQANSMLMRADHALFGVYVPFWLSAQSNFFRPVIAVAGRIASTSYGLLGAAISVAATLFFLYDERRMKLLILSFFFSSFMALPLWYAFPAVSPNDAFLGAQSVIDRSSIPHLREALAEYAPQESLARTVEQLHNQNDTFFITSFPSMHVAWGTIVAILMISWNPIVGIPFAIWWCFNTLGTMYLLQHYAVDVLLGCVVAVLALAFALKIIPASEGRLSSSARAKADIIKLLSNISSYCRRFFMKDSKPQ